MGGALFLNKMEITNYWTMVDPMVQSSTGTANNMPTMGSSLTYTVVPSPHIMDLTYPAAWFWVKKDRRGMYA